MHLSRRQRQSKISRAVFAAVALLVVSQVPAHAQGYPQGNSSGSPQSFPQSFPQGQMASGQMPSGQAPAQSNRPTDPALIKDWFGKYDMVRRQAQMSPNERNGADELLSHGLQVFVPGPEKVMAQKLLQTLVGKYDRACTELKGLPLYPETSALHHQYFKYFKEAFDLFSDYLRVQGNVMAKDKNGNSIFAGLMARKQNLEGTEQQAKTIDSEVRNRFGIAPYHF